MNGSSNKISPAAPATLVAPEPISVAAPSSLSSTSTAFDAHASPRAPSISPEGVVVRSSSPPPDLKASTSPVDPAALHAPAAAVQSNIDVDDEAALAAWARSFIAAVDAAGANAAAEAAAKEAAEAELEAQRNSPIRMRCCYGFLAAAVFLWGLVAVAAVLSLSASLGPVQLTIAVNCRSGPVAGASGEGALALNLASATASRADASFSRFVFHNASASASHPLAQTIFFASDACNDSLLLASVCEDMANKHGLPDQSNSVNYGIAHTIFISLVYSIVAYCLCYACLRLRGLPRLRKDIEEYGLTIGFLWSQTFLFAAGLFVLIIACLQYAFMNSLGDRLSMILSGFLWEECSDGGSVQTAVRPSASMTLHLVAVILAAFGVAINSLAVVVGLVKLCSDSVVDPSIPNDSFY